MQKLVTKILTNVFALLVVSYVVPGFYFSGLWSAVVSSIIIGVVNTFLRPVLQILFLPITIITYGVTAFLINVVLLWSVSYFVPGFDIDSFFTAAIASILLMLVNYFIHRLTKENKD